MQKFIISVTLLMTLYHSAISQTVGKPAPEILFSAPLNNKLITPANLKNKYVILDFWATWCHPCVASFPHFSELADKFASDSVLFAIMSSEEKDKVSRFLLKRPVKALYLLDSITEASKENATVNDLYGLTARGFGIEDIPRTVIIDKEGILRWTGTTAELTPAILNDILSMKFLKVQEELTRQTAEKTKEYKQRQQWFSQLKKDTINGKDFRLIMAEVPYKGDGIYRGNDGKSMRYIQFNGKTINFMCQFMKETSFRRIKNLLPGKDANYFMRFEMHHSVTDKKFIETALAAFAQARKISIQNKIVSTEVWTMRVVDPQKFIKNSTPLSPDDGPLSTEDNGEIVYTNYTLEGLLHDLEDKLTVFIEIEKNKLTSKISDLTIPKGNIVFISKKLLELYGIKLTKSTKKTEIIEIRKAYIISPHLRNSLD
ncbi:MAG: TlpA family protein disulfide reductase [Chitinophagaceae bacterium]|nr:TlpA family protein disulfide reductase [Chitinophagaceae bacterium]